MGNICNVSGKIYQGCKGIVGAISLAIAIPNFLNNNLLPAIFLTVVSVFTLGDIILNWSKYKLLDQMIEDQKRNNNILKGENVNFAQNNSTLKNENNTFVKSNNELEIHVDKLQETNNKYNRAITDLNEHNVQLGFDIIELNKTKIKNKEQLELLTNQVNELQSNVEKTKGILVQSRKLINSLMAGGDDFKEFNKIFEQNVNNLANTEHMLSALVNGIREDTFLEMDEDHDGTVTQEEYAKYLESLKQKKQFGTKYKKVHKKKPKKETQKRTLR